MCELVLRSCTFFCIPKKTCLTSCIVFLSVSSLQCGFRLTPKQVNTVSMFAVPLNNYKRDVLSSCGWPPLPRFSVIATVTLQSLNLSQKSCLSFCLFSSMVHSGHSQARWLKCCFGRPSYYTLCVIQSNFIVIQLECGSNSSVLYICDNIWSLKYWWSSWNQPAKMIIQHSHQPHVSMLALAISF